MASAASRISASSAAHKPQAANHAANSAGGADDSSPFSMLLNEMKSKGGSNSKDPAKDHGQDDSNASQAQARPVQKNAADDAAGKIRNSAAPQPHAAAKPAQKDAKSDPANDSANNAAPPDDNAAIPPPKPAASNDQTVSSDAAAPSDPAAQPQLALMAVPVQPAPANANGIAADADDGSESDPAAAVGAAGKAAPQAAAQASASTSAQTASPKIDAAQAAAPQPVDDGDGDGDNDDNETPVAGKAATPKSAARPQAQMADAGKIARTADDNVPRAAQNEPAPQPAQAAPAPAQPAPQPQTTAAQTIQNTAGISATAPSNSTPASAAQTIHVAPQTAPNVSALAVQIAAKSQSGARQFDIRLDPPELGRVDVRLSIDSTGKAQAHLTADQQPTLDLLQKDAPVLTRALREAGLDVSQDGLNFSLRSQANGNGDANAGSGGGQGGRRAMSLQAIKSIDAGTSAATWRGPIDGRLDIRV